MSLKQNDKLIEDFGERFNIAVDQHDYHTALAIARDFRDAGFGSGLLEELRNTDLSKFVTLYPNAATF